MPSPTELANIQQRKNDWASLMATPFGRRIIRHILFDLAGTHRGVFSTNALSMANAEGRRSLGQSIETEIDIAVPGAYASLLVEMSKEVSNG
jgi:hypothetical protein